MIHAPAWAVALVLASAMLHAAPLSDIDQYADRCAAELGAGTGAYMPLELLTAPDSFADSQEIPVFWNQKRITFVETDPTSGVPTPGTDHWEFVFDGQPGAIGFPDGANTLGRIKEADRANLKCDFWSHVNRVNRACIGGTRDGLICTGAVTCPGGGTCTTSVPSGCFPGQRALQRSVGTCAVTKAPCANDAACGGVAGSCRNIVAWSFVFRRLVPPKPNQVAFNAFHPLFFNNMDSIAFKPDTGGACWFDTLLVGTLQRNNWWVAAPGTPAGIPRPGGKDTAKQARAALFWETPNQIQTDMGDPGEKCSACHGTGPILVSRWINQGATFKSRRAREIAYWHTAKLFPDPFFKQFGAGTPAMQCGTGCHNQWSVSARTTPGGSLALAMTTVPGAGMASNFRRQIDASGAPFAKTCRSGAKDGQPCTADPECAPDGSCKLGQNAGIMREMPHEFDGTPAQWTAMVQPRFDAMKACLRTCIGGGRNADVCETNADCLGGGTCRAIDPAACSGTARAVIPTFYGAQSPAPPPKNQLIDPPYVAVNVSFARTDCVVVPDGSENCMYRAQWQDPTAGESDYHAADKYYLALNSVGNQVGQTPATIRFCVNVTTPVTASKMLQAGSNWAMSYTATGVLPVCTKSELRLCGGYAFDSAPGANDAHSPVDSRNDGDAERGTLVTACANRIKIERSGYRLHRATGRYVQTVTLKNNGTVAVTGPVTYLLFTLSANAALFAPTGTTAVIVPTGTPYVNVPVGAGLAPGANVQIQLEFTNPTNQAITYDARVRTGAGTL